MKDLHKICDLNSCFLCQACLPDWLPAISIHKKNFEIKKGQQIFKEGDSVSGIYFVYKGKVKVHKRWDKEKDLIIRFASPGDILGHLGMGNKPIYPVSTTALEPVTVCYLEMPFFETTLAVNNQLTLKLMRFFANELQESEKRMRNLVHMSVKARIAQALISLKNQFGINQQGIINIELSRQDIASFAGASYETLFKVANEFSDKKYIGLDGKKISIYQEDMLIRMIDEDNI